MIAYLTGPTEGYPEANFAAFADAAHALRAVGVEVLSPHEIGGGDLVSALAEASEALWRSDVVVTLPDWERSGACAVDVEVAKVLGTPVLALSDALLSLDEDAPGYLSTAV